MTKETLVNGVGLRFAIANWLMAAWAVCFVSVPSSFPLSGEHCLTQAIQTLQFFIGAEIVILLNVINVYVLVSGLLLLRLPSRAWFHLTHYADYLSM